MDVVDIALIGSGVASSLTLIEVLRELLNSSGGGKTTIAVIEKNHEFWKGIPYGSRSSVNALTITSIYDFINEQERPLFFKWLKDNKPEWSSWYREQGGITAARWLDNNLPLIEKEDWETFYAPRFLFGNYVREKLMGLRKEVEEKQLADIRLIHAEATDLSNKDGIYEITLEHPDLSVSTTRARKVVIAAGSAPVRKMCDLSTDGINYINDVYEPSINSNIALLEASLKKTGDKVDNNVLIIGSNASSIEWLYMLEGLPELRKLVNKTVIISPSGQLPLHISTEVLAEHPTPNIDRIKAGDKYTIKTLSDAAAADVKLALQNGANMDYVATVIGSTLALMEPLGEEAKKEFYCIHGIKLRDMFRRSGPEYKGVSQLLIEADEAVVIKGRFVKADPSGNGAMMHYIDAGGQQQVYPLTFKVILNCSGSDNLDQSSSRLLFNVVNKNLCTMNLSGKGIEVNEKFEAAQNLYVMGPLLAGNVNKLIHFWQLENASRLTYLAPFLAKELVALTAAEHAY